MTGKEFAHGAVTLGLGWSLALGVFFVGIRFLNGRFMSHDLTSLLIVTAVAATAQFLLCMFLVSLGPHRSGLLRGTFGATVGLPFIFNGIGAVFLAMFCMSGLVFGASLASIMRSVGPRISG